MDHLPLPLEPLLDPIEVPYRCAEPYDGSPMLDYPDRKRWEILHSPVGTSYLVDGQKPTDSQLESFIQNYLYFGLLYETFGKFIDIRKFITTNENEDSIITTAPLEECLTRWANQVEDDQDPESTEETNWWVHTQKVLGHTLKIALNTKKRFKNAVDERIWFSIAVLAETIQQVLFDLFRDPEKLPLTTGTWRTPQNPSIGKFITNEMLEKGWCIFDVHRIDLTTKGASTLYFLGNLQPTRSGRDHSGCTEDLCVWMTTDESYQTRHATHDCHCDSKYSGMGDVQKVLEGDEIPLIQRVGSKSDAEHAEYRIIPSIEAICGNFVAISHVWAEGLGNPGANELPSCSLKWVSDMVDSFGEEKEDFGIAFWIDTLCVPIEPHSLWLRAMNRLRKPYTEAAVVLVLDSYLYEQDSSTLSFCEIWARVLCCSWSRRLWTFQEGGLAKNLLYQFADRAIPLEEVFINMNVEVSLSASSMKTEMKTAYRSSNVIKNIGEIVPDYSWKVPDAPKKYRPSPTVRDMRESLQARAVSVIDDEALCLFCNMGFDMELVTDLAVEERMPMFWTQVREVPFGLIFSSAHKKLTRPGLHWAPASFLGDIETPHWYIEKYPLVNGLPTPRGLEIKAASLLFDSNLLVWDDSFDTIFTDQWLKVQDQDDRTWYFVEMDNKRYWNQDRKGDPKAGEQLAILLHKSVDDLDKDIDADPFSFQPSIMGVIGVITESSSEDRPPKIEVYRHARLHKFSRALQKYHNLVLVAVERFVMEELGYVGESKRDEQGRFYETFTAPEYLEGEEPEENVENFRLTDERRVLCQEYSTRFAENNIFARDITLKVGYNEGKMPQTAFEHFGWHARLQLQMRRRNSVKPLGPTQLWCVD